jgi:putative serine protease PepD
MTQDPSSGRDPASGRLWTEPREEEEHTQWVAPRPLATEATAVHPPREPESDSVPRGDRRRPWRAGLLATLVAFVLFGTGFLGALLFRGDAPSSNTPVALPAAPGSVAPTARSRAASLASPSVVLVRVQNGGSGSTGTGFVVDSNGTIVTAAHVVDGGGKVQVRFKDNDGSLDAEVLGTDESSDLAVLRVDASQAPHVRPLALADSDRVRVGDPTLAIGYPLGLDRTVTSGIVSGVGRAIEAPNGFSIDKVIQTDAAINPGNSGGPLLDGAGRVIGVNSQIATTVGGGGGNVGIGFAVPSNTVREVVPRLRAGATIRRAYLGVSTRDDPAGAGALVERAVVGGPAQNAGMQVGDVISRVDSRPIGSSKDVSPAIENKRPGDEVDVEVQRGGTSKTLHVTLGTRPATVAPPSLSTGP